MASFLNRDEFKDLESLSSKIAGSIKEVKRLYTEAFYLAKDHGGVAKRISDTLSLMPDIQSKYNKILNRTLNEKQKELNKILDIKNSYAKINDQLLRSQRVLENLSNLKATEKEGMKSVSDLMDKISLAEQEQIKLNKIKNALNRENKKILAPSIEEIEIQRNLSEQNVSLLEKQLKAHEHSLQLELSRLDINESLINSIQKQIDDTENKLIDEKATSRELEKQKKFLLDLVKLREEEVKNLKSAIEDNKTFTDELRIQAVQTHNMAKNLETLKGGQEIFSRISRSILGPFFDAEKAMTSLKEKSLNSITGLKGILQSVGEGFSGIGKFALIVSSITALIKIFKYFVDLAKKADEQVTSLARGLSLSKSEAIGIRDGFLRMESSLRTQYKTIESIVEAQSQLSDITNFSLLYGKETLDAQIQLTKEFKLSSEEATKLNQLFISNGIQGNQGLDIIKKQNLAFFKQTGILPNLSKTFKLIKDISGQILVTFKGNVAALTQAVLKTEKLGINLAKARDISRSLLEFDSSIESELEAELLIGKNLNFERARGLALQGKYAEASEEVLKQVGDIDNFNKLNVLQQEAISKSIGMSVDELSEALLKQKLITGEAKAQIARYRELGENKRADALEQRMINGDSYEQAEKSLTAQEKFNNALEKAQEIFRSLVDGGNLNKLVDLLNKIVDNVNKLTGDYAPTQLKDSSNRVKELEKQLSDKSNLDEKEIQSLEKELIYQKQLVSAAAKDVGMSAIDIWDPFFGKINRFFRGYEIDKVKSQKPIEVQDSIIRPNQAPIKFNKDDIVLTGTNLLGEKRQDNNKLDILLEKLDKMITLMNNPKDVVIQNQLSIDSNKLFNEASKHMVRVNG